MMDGRSKYVLALDIGTSAVKAVLFDTAGRSVGMAQAECELEKPAPGRVEIDPEIYWKSVQSTIATVLEVSGVAPGDIPAIGITSQGETLIPVDRDGNVLRKALSWLDNRAVREAEAIAAAFDIDEVYRITGQQEIVPGWTASKILWLRNHEPEVFQITAKFLLVEDYIIHKLTGRYVTDHALVPSTLYYDLTAGDWWDGMLDFLGISRAQLPELQYSGHNGIPVTAEIGLSHETLVVTTPIDQITGAVGAGNTSPGMVAETTGTSMAISACCAKLVYDPQRRVGVYRHAVPGSYVLLPWIPTAGMILRWFRDELGGGLSFDELANEAKQVPAGSDGLILLPHFSGAVCPQVNPFAKGVLYGLSLGHTRGHIVRAIMESVAFILKENLEMLQALGVETETVCSIGGGAQSDLWLQIKADVLNRKICAAETQEATCLGAAVLAAVGAGIYPNLDQAAKQMVRHKPFIHPDPAAAVAYAGHYEKYLELNRLLLPTFGEEK